MNAVHVIVQEKNNEKEVINENVKKRKAANISVVNTDMLQ